MTVPTRPADLVNPRAGEQLWFETDQTGTRIQGICPAHSPGPPMHRQLRTQENPTVVRGRIRYIVDGRVHELGPGDSVLIPPGTLHRFENPYDEEAEIDNHTRPRLVHEVGLRLLYAATARKRPNPLELAVAFHDGDNFPAFLPLPITVAVVTLLYWISKATGVANRFRQAVLPASLA
jgi:mannose-6-phosphate isomerase-like protein (cupin superfamily)